jgi:hypothetical protein
MMAAIISSLRIEVLWIRIKCNKINSYFMGCFDFWTEQI